MDDKENIVKVRKSKDGLFLPLPEILCRGLEIGKGDRFILSLNERDFIVAKPAKMVEGENCEICQEHPKRYTCINCKRKVCSNCFWEMGGICTKCGYVGKKKAGAPEGDEDRPKKVSKIPKK